MKYSSPQKLKREWGWDRRVRERELGGGGGGGRGKTGGRGERERGECFPSNVKSDVNFEHQPSKALFKRTKGDLFNRCKRHLMNFSIP